MASAEHLAAVGTNRNPDAIKIAIVQMAIAGKSYSEIAAELDVARGVVSGVIYRARKALKSSPAPLRSAPATDRVRKAVPKPKAVPTTTEVWQPRPVHITGTKDGQCRWPLWKADAPFSAKLVCGLPAKRNAAYCEHCYGLSYSASFTSYIDKKLGIKAARAA